MLFSSKPIEVSEHKDYKLATFLISVLDEYNENGVLIPKDIGEKLHSTIVGFPIVAKLVTDIFGKPIDFKGHGVVSQKDKDGNNVYKFSTMPIGSVLKSWTEDRNVQGYEGKKSCIMIQAKLWKSRFPEYFNVLDKMWSENNVSSSWEISVEDFEMSAKGKILKAFSFIGNCILGRSVKGAVKSAGMIEYAEIEEIHEDFELAQALSLDCINKENEVKELPQKNKNVVVENSETVVEEIEKKTIISEEIDVSTLTIFDLERKISEVFRSKSIDYGHISHIFVDEKYILTHNYKQTDLEFRKYSYDIVDDTVTVSNDFEIVKLVIDTDERKNEIASKDEKIIQMNNEIETLKSQITEISEYKTKYEEMIAEKEKIEKAEKIKALEDYAIKSGYVTSEEIETSEEIKNIISSLDEVKLNSIIVERLMNNKQNEVSVAEKDIKTSNSDRICVNLSNVEDDVFNSSKSKKSCSNIMKEYINS